MKNLFLFMVTVFILSGCHQNLAAVNKTPESLKANQPKAGMENQKFEKSTANPSLVGLQQGASFQSERETYIFLPELYSVSENRKVAAGSYGSLKSIQEEKASALVDSKGRFSIYKSGDVVAAMSPQTVQEQTLLPVVLNPRTNNLAIVPGTIRVKLEDMDQAEFIAEEFELNLRRKFAHLKTAYFSVAEGQDILAKTDALKEDYRVTAASIEVIEHIMVPH